MANWKEILNTMREWSNNNVTQYISHSGNYVFRITGNLDTYFELCYKFKLRPKCISSLEYEAHERDFEFDWCEEDIMLIVPPEKMPLDITDELINEYDESDEYDDYGYDYVYSK